MSRSPPGLIAAALLLATLSLFAPPAQAQQVRAWLDRDQIALGETATLNIESDQVAVDAPDYSPLLGDFRVSGNTSSRSFQRVNGVNRARTLFAVALQPNRSGVIGIPGLVIGNQRTQPLTLTVTAAAAAAAPAPAQAGDVVFLQSQADARQPYVQQAVGYVVRLYSATPLISGQLDQVAPEGATLQRVGDDIQYNREIGGQRYNVIERQYLLIPERSGVVTVPAAEFQGRGTGGFFDDLFGDGQRDLRASSAPQRLQVRRIPDQAPQPWLPLRSLQLRYLGTPQEARVGEAFDVTVEATVDGATAAQLPELQLPSIPGAQVFADPPQFDESFKAGRPQLRLTRKYSVVPGRSGAMQLRSPRLDWWDVQAGSRRTASLPDLQVQVAADANATAATAGPDAGSSVAPMDKDSGASGWMRVPGVQGEVRPWAFAAVVFALLWLVTLMWGLHRYRHPHPQAVGSDEERNAPKPYAHASMAQLRHALDRGSLDDVGRVLCAMAVPAASDTDDLLQHLDDIDQREAVAMLQRARWGDGDGVATRTALRAAFKQGPRWRPVEKTTESPLPPLYPPS